MINTTRATRGIAVSSHSLAAQSAAVVLREGGNAVEAMIAAAATIAVAYPHMNGLGGDAFWLLYAPGEPVRGIDASGAAAAAATRELYTERGLHTIPSRGPLAANTVAGTVSGWDHALGIARAWGGRMPLSRLLEDAIHYARDGIPVTNSQAANTSAKLAELALQPGFADTFLVDGQPPLAGSVFRQPRVAATLEQLVRAGLDDFYRGELAAAIAEDFARVGAPLTRADLERHEARETQPLALRHSHGTVYNLAPPSQGVVSLIILGILDRLGVDTLNPGSAHYVHYAVEATKRAFQVRDRYVTDPTRMQIDMQSLLDKRKLDAMASQVDANRAFAWGGATTVGDTVWMGVIDGAGRAVSFIQSTYHEFGSGIVLPQTGINWQNRGCSFALEPRALNTLEPGRKPSHTLNPALALLNDGRTMVYGAMGGDGQTQTQAAVFTRYVMMGMGLQAAVTAPRWLLGRTWGSMPESLKLERRFGAQTVAELKRRGHVVDLVGDYDETMGHAGALVRNANGVLEGAFDPRSDGGVAGF